MGERELRAKYGGKLAKAINRAIRAELPGGNDALDTLTKLAGPAMQSGWKAPNGDPTPEAVVYSRHKRDVVDKMEAQIRRKWGISEEMPARPARPDRRSTKRSGGSRAGGVRAGGARSAKRSSVARSSSAKRAGKRR